MWHPKNSPKEITRNHFKILVHHWAPQIPRNLVHQIPVPTSESNRCPVSLFSLVPRVTPDRRACASSRGRCRDFRRLSLSLSFFLFFFFSFQQGRTSTILGTKWTFCGCAPISPTLGLLCLTTPKAKCVMSVSPSVFRQLEVPSVPLVQFSCTRASHAPHPEHG